MFLCPTGASLSRCPLANLGPGANEPVLIGIELKGWFILAKEGEPSFRYKASPKVRAPRDLLVVFPWRLDEVISGAPRLMRTFIEEARYAAEHRHHYWRVPRGVSGDDANINEAAMMVPYPMKGQKFNDEAKKDQGKNFGRVARGGLMTDFIAALPQEPVSGFQPSIGKPSYGYSRKGSKAIRSNGN